MRQYLLISFSLLALATFQRCDKIDKIYGKISEKTEPVVQTVQVAGPPAGSDGLAIDRTGNLFATDNIGTSPDPFNGNGTTVYKITPQGVRTLFADGLNGPAGCSFDKEGNFYVCTFRDGKLIKIQPNGNKQVLAQGLEGPIQVVPDKKGNLFVTVAGLGDIPGTKVYKFAPDGTKSVLADLLPLGGIALAGMTIDKEDNLYVGNYANDIIHKITPDGNASVFAHLSLPGIPYIPITGYLTYANDNIYLAAIFANRIYKITMSAQVSVLAGTGVEGSMDGKPAVATFAGPNGVAVDPTGNILYISESAKQRLRRIIFLKKL
jgi:sugar lactone lactonase YvrE